MGVLKSQGLDWTDMTGKWLHVERQNLVTLEPVNDALIQVFGRLVLAEIVADPLYGWVFQFVDNVYSYPLVCRTLPQFANSGPRTLKFKSGQRQLGARRGGGKKKTEVTLVKLY